MKKILLLIAVIGMIGTGSCKKDKDGGRKDPCAQTVCFNDGYCENGDCVCPPGFRGPQCLERTAPDTMYITEITVTKFPDRTGTQKDWDSTDGPDISPVLSLGNKIVWSCPMIYQNVFGNKACVFPGGPKAIITSPTSVYALTLYDSDHPNPPELMGQVHFIPYPGSKERPETLILDAGGGLAFRIKVSYH